ncbi:MAG: DUF559 domain-containing protein [Planctomycetota bacterium]
MMEATSPAPPTIPSSQIEGGPTQAPWRSVRAHSAVKHCAACGEPFRPWMHRKADGSLSVMKERDWHKQRFCSISCSKKLENPMQSQEARRAMRKRLRELRWKPIRRCGNGRLLSLPQLALFHALGPGWEPEWTLATNRGRESGWPTNYKIDIANPKLKIAIEIDGQGHRSKSRKVEDQRKSLFLAENGWLVLRVSNARALNLYSTFRSTDTLLTSLMGFLPTTVT